MLFCKLKFFPYTLGAKANNMPLHLLPRRSTSFQVLTSYYSCESLGRKVVHEHLIFGAKKGVVEAGKKRWTVLFFEIIEYSIMLSKIRCRTMPFFENLNFCSYIKPMSRRSRDRTKYFFMS